MEITRVNFRQNTINYEKNARVQTNPIMVFAQALGNIKLNTLERDVFVKQPLQATEDIAFTGQVKFTTNEFKKKFNKTFFKKLVREGVPDAYTGKAMISQEDIDSLKGLGVLKKKSSIAMKYLKEYEDTMYPIEKEIYYILKNLAKKHPDLNLQELLQMKHKRAEEILIQQQTKILDKINMMIRVLPRGEYLQARKFINGAFDKILDPHPTPETRFSRKVFLHGLEELKISDPKTKEKIMTVATRLPQSSNSINAVKKSLVPFDLKPFADLTTGAAANVGGGCSFPDVPQGHWAACDIDKLAMNDVVVGYPDGFYKPNRSISRAEFATMLVKGFNLDDCDMERTSLFSDVPRGNWANAAIAKAVDENLLKGYPNGQFKPNNHVTRAEALTSIAKGMTCDIDKCKAEEILSRYKDGASVPGWARIPVAKSLESGALKDAPNPNMIMPHKDASRAEVASMLQTVRVALGYDTNPKTANSICPACPVDKNAFVEEQEIVKIPTLKISMIDQITAKSSHVGQYFRAKTLEDVTINGH